MRMKPLALAAVLLCLAADTAKDAAKKDQEKLQGNWVLVSGERDGEQFPEDVVKSLKRTMKDNAFTVFRDDQTLAEGAFTLDPSKKPKTIDLQLKGGDKPVHGIYELDGDTFRICYSAPGEQRPTELATKADSGRTLAVWKRAKK
jgi:uncharacterized protein (TIGR03067 family)